MIAPQQPSTVDVHCPQCRGIFRVEGAESGESTQCPFCESAFTFRDADTVVLDEAPDWVVVTERDGSPTRSNASTSKPSSNRTPNRGIGATDLDDRTDLVSGDVINGYRLEEIVGSGGMSVVFRATQLSLDRDVAFKVLRKDLSSDPEFTRRFFKEARALAELGHQNIVAVYDQGQTGDHCYLVMEYVDGVSLREILEDRRLRPEDVLDVAPRLCGALEYAHGKGYIHRDIKPENILIDRDGTPKIADFGLVRIVGDPLLEQTRLTKTRTVLGTVDYMSPEQREGRSDVDHRSDLFSLGVVLYEMLTGELPIARFPRPSERSQCDSRLDEIVMRLLEKDRERRFGRASAISRALLDVSTSPGPPPRTSREGPTKPNKEDGEPADWWERVIEMGASFSFFVFSFLFVIALIANSRHEPSVAMLVGLAIPFYVTQLLRYGFIPRPRLPKRLWMVEHPILTFGCLSGCLYLSFDQHLPGFAFLVGLTASFGLCLARWRREIIRTDRDQPPYRRTPPTVPRTVLDRDQGHGRPVSSAVHRQGERTATPASTRSGPLPEEMSNRTVASAQAAEATSTSPRSWLSLSTLLSFLLVVPMTLFAIAAFITVVVLGPWDLFFRNPDINDMGRFLEDLWLVRPERLERWIDAVAVMIVIPILVPLALQVFALPSIISKRTRGAGLASVNILLGIVAAIMLMVTSSELIDSARDYETIAGEPVRGQHDVEHAALFACDTNETLARYAHFHRLRLGLRVTEHPDSVIDILGRLASNPDEHRHDRRAAQLLIDTLNDQRETPAPTAF